MGRTRRRCGGASARALLLSLAGALCLQQPSSALRHGLRPRPPATRLGAFNYDPWGYYMNRTAGDSMAASASSVEAPPTRRNVAREVKLQPSSAPPPAPTAPTAPSNGRSVQLYPQGRNGAPALPVGYGPAHNFTAAGVAPPAPLLPDAAEAARLLRVNAQLRGKLAYLESRVRSLENTLSLTRISRAKMSGGQLDSADRELALQIAPGLPEQEQLLLGCTAAGAIAGLAVGNVLRHTVLWMHYIGGSGLVGAIAGAVLAVYYSNRDDGPGHLTRAAGKLVVLLGIRSYALGMEVAYLWDSWQLPDRIATRMLRFSDRFGVTRMLNDCGRAATATTVFIKEIPARTRSGVASLRTPVATSRRMKDEMIVAARVLRVRLYLLRRRQQRMKKRRAKARAAAQRAAEEQAALAAAMQAAENGAEEKDGADAADPLSKSILAVQNFFGSIGGAGKGESAAPGEQASQGGKGGAWRNGARERAAAAAAAAAAAPRQEADAQRPLPWWHLGGTGRGAAKRDPQDSGISVEGQG